MEKLTSKFIALLIIILSVSIISCDDEDDAGLKDLVFQIQFEHQIEGEMVELDKMKYTNEAGNQYEITEAQWFISRVELNTAGGTNIVVSEDSGLHYVDTNIPESLSWSIPMTLKDDQVNGIEFVFGFKAEDNTVGRFPDQPESNMFWPMMLGGENGGYHYMKLNGFRMDTANTRAPFGYHLGVSRTFDADSMVIHHQNWFSNALSFSVGELSDGDTVIIPLVMNIENWFKNPNTWDINEIGSMIMPNQKAQEMAKANGEADVFSIGEVVKK